MRGWVIALLLAACGGSDEEWQLLGEPMPATLAVWGTGARDVWVTGGRSEIAGPPLLLHYDGAAWSTVDTGLTGFDLWWVFGVPGTPTKFFGGSNGTILRATGSAFEMMTTPHPGIVFGIWGASETDVWAVGSDNGRGFVWHYDGTAWTAQTLPPEVTSRLFKVHGQSPQDVWICGADGVTLHWNGSALELVPTNLQLPLFSIITTPALATAVGGDVGDGALLENTGSWTRDPLEVPAVWRGVAAGGDRIFAVGEYGAVAERGPGGWTTISQSVAQRSFHAAWVDPDGGLWGVGGDFDRTPLTSRGFITYFGSERPRSVP